jgi:hypothetical protein
MAPHILSPPQLCLLAAECALDMKADASHKAAKDAYDLEAMLKSHRYVIQSNVTSSGTNAKRATHLHLVHCNLALIGQFIWGSSFG